MSLIIGCDQMIWIQNALTRYAQMHHAVYSFHPKIAQHYAETHQVACIIELMEILDLGISESSAEGNLFAAIRSKIPNSKQYTNPPTKQEQTDE